MKTYMIKYLFATNLLVVLMLAGSTACVSGGRGDAGQRQVEKDAAPQAGFINAAAEGFWYSREFGLVFGITADAGIFRVVSAVPASDPHREGGRGPAELKESLWEAGALVWTCFFPETGYTLMVRAVRVDGDSLFTLWSGTAEDGAVDFGEELLVRFDEGDDSFVEEPEDYGQ
jgi:hypothetical protein